MVIARRLGVDLQLIDRLRDPVQLASGLQEDNTLDQDSQERALECLARFGERVKRVPSDCVRAVGTNTLRRARNIRSFLTRARAALGHDIEVLPGREEARLIYLGVAHASADDSTRRLVVDIGGGSTECIIGERFQPIRTDSLFMGCVGFSRRFFPDGEISRKKFDAAKVAAELELQPIVRRYRQLGWQSCVGASGTIRAIEAIVREHSGTPITRAGLDRLERAIIDAGRFDRLTFLSLEPDRRNVLAGGLAILSAVVDMFDVDEMQASAGALREGLLWDQLGRIDHEDVRIRTIDSMCERYVVDREHAARVERMAVRLLDSLADAWSLEEERARRLLEWACRLHEIGLTVNHSGQHKHGQYLIANAEMPGFSRDEQLALGAIVRAHRRKIARDMFGELPDDLAPMCERLAVILRLAVLLNRSRDAGPPVPQSVEGSPRRLRLRFPESDLDRRPLTRADLEQETTYLAKIGLELRFE
jgi:exopolyphosphatase/guanosine-5'-triphosphate,3'-diphosphate pyrophosphatase